LTWRKLVEVVLPAQAVEKRREENRREEKRREEKRREEIESDWWWARTARPSTVQPTSSPQPT
jgi:hypothetical protein